tara:strand:- start:235 stop:393 length:159 start_codon:yes stop_codon:yes gene_type:complete
MICKYTIKNNIKKILLKKIKKYIFEIVIHPYQRLPLSFGGGYSPYRFKRPKL